MHNTYIKAFDELTFTDDFIFWKVLTGNLDLCQELLEVILGRKISALHYAEGQKTLEEAPDGRGIRLDVYVEGETEAYSLEMQNINRHNVPKRSRYYQGMIDLGQLEKSVDFNMLRPSYVIFICAFDVFDKGAMKYTFENRCLEYPDLSLGDETTKIIVNGKATALDGRLGEFIQFLSGAITGEFSQKLQTAVDHCKRNKEWRKQYMTLSIKMWEMEEDAKRAGMEAGMKAGMEEGMKAGMEEGMKAGMEEGMEEGMKAGMEAGMKAGRAEGIEAGRIEGIEAGRASLILSALANATKEQVKSFLAVTDEEIEGALRYQQEHPSE